MRSTPVIAWSATGLLLGSVYLGAAGMGSSAKGTSEQALGIGVTLHSLPQGQLRFRMVEEILSGPPRGMARLTGRARERTREACPKSLLDRETSNECVYLSRFSRPTTSGRQIDLHFAWNSWWQGALMEDGLLRWLDRRADQASPTPLSWRVGWAKAVSPIAIHLHGASAFTVFAAVETLETAEKRRPSWRTSVDGLCDLALSPTPRGPGARLLRSFESGPVRRDSRLALMGSQEEMALIASGYTIDDELGYTLSDDPGVNGWRIEHRNDALGANLWPVGQQSCASLPQHGLRGVQRQMERVYPALSAQIRVIGLTFDEFGRLPERVLNLREPADGWELESSTLAAAVDREGRRVVGYILRRKDSHQARLELVSADSGEAVGRIELQVSDGPLQIEIKERHILIWDLNRGQGQRWELDERSSNPLIQQLGDRIDPARRDCLAVEVPHSTELDLSDTRRRRPNCEGESNLFAWSRDPRSGTISLRGLLVRRPNSQKAQLVGEPLLPGSRPAPICAVCETVILRGGERLSPAPDLRLILLSESSEVAPLPFGQSPELTLVLRQRRDLASLPRPKAGQRRIEFIRARPGNLIDAEVGAALKGLGWREVIWRYHGLGPALSQTEAPRRSVRVDEALSLIEKGAKPYLLLAAGPDRSVVPLPFSWVEVSSGGSWDGTPWPRSRTAPILVYGSGPDDPLPIAAERWLNERGYRDVSVLRGGLLEWRTALYSDPAIKARALRLGLPIQR